MPKGFDCASTVDLSTAKTFFARTPDNSYDFIMRYLADNWKGMSASEAKILLSVGLKLGTVYEREGTRAELIGANGASLGQDAFQIAQRVAQPLGSAIYFPADFETVDGDMDNIEAFLRAADPHIPGYEIGVYGSFYVIEAMHARGACKHFWQTAAWSNRKISQYANIYQSAIDLQKNGIGIDENISYGNEGFWGSHSTPIINQVDCDLAAAALGALWTLGVTAIHGVTVSQADIHTWADTVRAAKGKTYPSISAAIGTSIANALGELWKLGVTELQGKPVDRNEIHRVADVIRAASGIPTT